MSEGEGTIKTGTIKTLEDEMSAVTHAEYGRRAAAGAGLLPGEVSAHPTPFKYVMLFLILVVVTGVEIGISYLEGSVSSGIIVALLLIFGLVKFVLVAAYYMHLRTDQPIFRRFFIVGFIAAIALYTALLAMLHAF